MSTLPVTPPPTHPRRLVSPRIAVVFENGLLQVWDRRMTHVPDLKIRTHGQPTFSVDWNPMREWVLATGSRDKTVKVWDLSSVTKSEGTTQDVPCINTLQCTGPVGRAKWRPGHANHIATRAGDTEMVVFDVRKPFVPLVVLEGGQDIKTGFCWCDTPAGNHSERKAPEEEPHHHDAVAPLKPHRRWRVCDGHPSGFGSRRYGAAGHVGGGAERRGRGRGGGWEREEDTSQFLGVWQHIISCSKDGVVRLHSLPRSRHPVVSIPDCALDFGPGGEVVCVQDRVDRRESSLGIYRDRDVQVAPGVFREHLSAEFCQGSATAIDSGSLKSNGLSKMQRTRSEGDRPKSAGGQGATQGTHTQGIQRISGGLLPHHHPALNEEDEGPTHSSNGTQGALREREPRRRGYSEGVSHSPTPGRMERSR
ncbi:unnamed protein product [Discosporangium mesarthrocarpum]